MITAILTGAWWTLFILALLGFAAAIGRDAGEREERRRQGRPEFQSDWGSEDAPDKFNPGE